MALRFLIDENLSDLLAACAHARGFEAQYVPHVGLQASSDARLVQHALAGGWILVTNNSDDFLRLLRDEELHAGIILLITQVPPMLQVMLFEAVLDVLKEHVDLINVIVRADVDDATRGRLDQNTRLSDGEWVAIADGLRPRITIEDGSSRRAL